MRTTISGALLCLVPLFAATGCGSGTGPQYSLSGVWLLSVSEASGAYPTPYQLQQSGSTVAGFTYGGLPRIGVCGSAHGSDVQLSFNG